MKPLDVVVVGAGLPGLACALRLAEGGARVAVIEERSAAGLGASGRGLGLCVPLLAEEPWRTHAGLGATRWAALVDFGRAGCAFALDITPATAKGALWTAHDPQETTDLDRSAASLREAGVDSQRLEPEATEALAGLRVASLRLAGGSAVSSEAVAAGLKQRLAMLSVPVRTGRAARGIADSPSGTPRVLTDAGPIDAEVVVLAAETGLTRLDDWFADKITPVREHLVDLTAPATYAGLGQHGWFAFAPVGENRVRVQGARWATPHFEAGEWSEDATPDVADKLRPFALAQLAALSPSVAGEVWAIRVGHPCDGLPIVGPLPGRPRLAVAAGFGGLECAFGLAAGLAVAAGLLGGPGLVAPDFLSPTRFV